MMLLKVFIILVISILSEGVLTPVKVPKYLAIYYGYPSLVQNCNGNLTAASNWFKQFDLIVFGDKIWNASHPDHNNTIVIIGNLNANNKLAYGYVDLGVNSSTQNLSETQMSQAVDAWSAMGCKGIFWDDAGYDYGVTRTRQSNMIQYCHSKNMNVIMNAWNPDDVMGGQNVSLNANDTYISESYLVQNGTYQPLTTWKTKADKCANYSKTLGVKLACLSTPTTNDQYTQSWFGAAMYNCDYYQSTDIYYSSSNNILNFTLDISTSYGTTWQSDTIAVNGDNTNFSRSTEAWTLTVVGDGSTWGYGTFSQVPAG